MTDSDNEAMLEFQGGEGEELSRSSNDQSITSTSKTSKTRQAAYNVDDTGMQKISKLVAAQLNQDRERQREVEGSDIPNVGFISASDIIHVPTTQENNILWKYCLTLYHRRNASPHPASMLDLFKSFLYDLLHQDNHASILPLVPEHSSFTNITSAKPIQAMDLSQMKI